jgi:hypothetical protein
MSMRLNVGLGLVLVAVVSGVAGAQDVSQRIAEIQRQKAVAEEVAAQRAGVSSRVALRSGIEHVALDNVGLQSAIEWLHHVTGLNIIVHWKSLEEVGITPQTPVSIGGANMTAETALGQILKQISPEQPLVWELNPYYIEIMTKAMANTRPVVRVYPVGDLMHTVPNFTDAPSFDLSAVTQSGGGKGGGSGALFKTDSATGEQAKSKQEQMEELAKLIRDTVEPEIWKENGGTVGSISFYRESLVIRAPMYVHRQIGLSQSQGVSAVNGGATAGGLVGGAGGVAAGKPQVGVVNSGTTVDVTGVVGGDPRYVTIGGGVSAATLRRIRQVPVQSAAGAGNSAVNAVDVAEHLQGRTTGK